MYFFAPQVLEAIEALYGKKLSGKDLTLQQTRKEFEGQITLVAFSLSKVSKKSPEQTAKEIGDYLFKHATYMVRDFNVIHGFLNISLTDAYWLNLFQNVICTPRYGVFQKKEMKVVLEYSSPNTNKPLHLGHIRNTLLGYAVANILTAYGYEVTRVNLINDRGIHVCKSMLAWQKFSDGETPDYRGIKGDHFVGKYYVLFENAYKRQIQVLMAQGQSELEAKKNALIMQEAQQMLRKWETGDPDVVHLWKQMNAWVYKGFEQSYKRLGVQFDNYYYESNTYLLGKDITLEGLARGIFYKKDDNSVWIDLTAEGLDEKLVLRSDGTSVYITQDLGTAKLKYDDFQMDQSIYVVGDEQDYHFKVLFSILKKFQEPWGEGLHHLSYGMVDLPSGRMKSREGTVVDADDLMEELVQTARQRTEELRKAHDLPIEEKEQLYEMIGLGALKYFLLKVEPKKRLVFDPNESVDFHGNTASFIQYTHARVYSVLNKSQNGSADVSEKPSSLEALERDVIILLSNYIQVIEQAANEYNPAHIANYLYELAKLYNRFYQELPILKAEKTSKQFRLALSAATASVLKKGMGLLGIKVPERM